MAFKLIGQDCAVGIALGGPVDGRTQAFGAAVDYKFLAKSIELDHEILDVDVSSLADGLERLRAKRSRATLRLKLQVNGQTGASFPQYVGYAAFVAVKEHYALVGERDYVGIISKASLSIEDGETIETVEVKIGIDGWTYTGVYA